MSKHNATERAFLADMKVLLLKYDVFIDVSEDWFEDERSEETVIIRSREVVNGELPIFIHHMEEFAKAVN